jgi:hypothetical protein
MTTAQTVILVLAVIALIFAAVDQWVAQGRSLVTWAVVFISVALIYQQVV